MMCQRIGRPPISTIGFGLTAVSSRSLVPLPPHMMITFMGIMENLQLTGSGLRPAP